jgi:hypothetical protein
MGILEVGWAYRLQRRGRLLLFVQDGWWRSDVLGGDLRRMPTRRGCMTESQLTRGSREYTNRGQSGEIRIGATAILEELAQHRLWVVIYNFWDSLFGGHMYRGMSAEYYTAQQCLRNVMDILPYGCEIDQLAELLTS